jgi:methyl-accepting chemotaxis protein
MGLLDRISVRAKLWVLGGSLIFIAVCLWAGGMGFTLRLGAQSTRMRMALQEVNQAGDLARLTEINFKFQVQEWKDMLIRGHDPLEMAHHRQAFEEREQAGIRATILWSTLFDATLLALGVGLAVLISQVITARIRGSLLEVTNGIGRMVEGDFSREVRVRSRDELGRMAVDFNLLQGRLQELFGQLRDASAHVASGSAQVGAAHEILALMTQTHGAMRDGMATVEGTESSLRALRQDIQVVAELSRDIGVTSDEQNRTSQELAHRAEESAVATKRSAAAAQQLTSTVEEVNQTASYLARIAKELASSLARFKTV